MTKPFYHLSAQRREQIVVDRAKETLRKAGIPTFDRSFLELDRVGQHLRVSFGLKIPRPMTLLFKLFGLSPGTLSLWHNAESGFFSEARARPGAPPVYRAVPDEVAMTILKGELTHELEAELMAPPVDIDN